MPQLPKTLEREPLVDAVFEVRLGGDPHVADILTGVLFGQLNPKPEIQRLPAADIPQPIRAGNPALAFAPITRLNLSDFTISFGDKSIVISCKLPYPKWPRFKHEIVNITKLTSQAGIIGPVERYSLKYVNLIKAPTIAEQISKINMRIKLGEAEAINDHVSIQVHHQEGETLHIMSVVTGAQVQFADGQQVFGAVVDIDSIRNVNFADFREFSDNLESDIESLRQANKVKFFSCLTEAAINEMGPKYD